MKDKRIYIYGAGKWGKVIERKIVREGFSNRFAGFIDQNPDIICEKIIFSEVFFEKAVDMGSVIIVAIQNIEVMQNIAVKLKMRGWEVYYLDPNFIDADMKLFNEKGEFSFGVYKIGCNEKPVLPYIEYQVTDHCNLNCKQCSHFSNLVEKPQFSSVDEFKKDMIQLEKHFKNINRIRLMGGEPLLNKNLVEYVIIARKCFPYSEISIVTNGILIKNISDEDFEAYRAYGVLFDVSQYPPLSNSINSCIEILKNHGINYKIGALVDKFFVNLSKKGNQNYVEAFEKKCLSKRCHFLRKGRLFVCPRIPMAYELKEKLGYKFTEEEFKESSIDLYDKTINGWMIIERLNTPVYMCRICTTAKYVKWAQSKSKSDGEFFYD